MEWFKIKKLHPDSDDAVIRASAQKNPPLRVWRLWPFSRENTG